MNIRRLWAAPALALLIGAGACDRGLTDININPNAPEAVPAENLLANAIVSGVGGAYGTNGVWSGLYLLNLWPQHLAQPVYNTEDRYVPRDAQVSGIWDVIYTGPLPDLQEVKRVAEETGNPNLHAVGEILTQYLFQYLTDIYGDIPYSEALQAPAITAPKYDAQQDVYAGMLDKLAAAAAEIDRGVTSASFAQGDLIYRGNMEKWYRFANSLRMRMAMRIADAAPQLARQHFQAAYAAGGFQSNDDNAILVWGTSVPNQNPRYDQFYNQNRRDQVVSAALVDRLQAWNDPRLPIFADPARSDGAYRGLPNGFTPGELGRQEPDFSMIGAYFLRPDAPSVLMAYSEVLFLAAEAAARGWIAGDPAQLYRNAIRASMQQYGITDPVITTYLAQPAVQYTGLTSIYEQKWVALYLVGTEAWAELRRTGRPQLTPAAGDRIPTRLPYPGQEQLYNPANYRNTTLWTPVWWMGN